MLVKILKSFPFTRNGTDVVQAVEGTEADIPDPYIDGLLRERFVAMPAARKFGTSIPIVPDQALKTGLPSPENKMLDPVEETGAAVALDQPKKTDIPAGWRTLSWPKLRALASSLSAEPVRNKDDAIAAVEAAQNR